MELQRQQILYQFGGSGLTVRVTATKSANGPSTFTVAVIAKSSEPVKDATEAHLQAALQALHLARSYARAEGTAVPVEAWPTGEVQEVAISLKREEV